LKANVSLVFIVETVIRDEEAEAGGAGAGNETRGGQAHCTDGVCQVPPHPANRKIFFIQKTNVINFTFKRAFE
jgi:hypothetical protein